MLKVGKDRKESIHRKLKGYDLDSPAWYGGAHLQSQLSKKLKLEDCRFKARMSILTRSWLERTNGERVDKLLSDVAFALGGRV